VLCRDRLAHENKLHGRGFAAGGKRGDNRTAAGVRAQAYRQADAEVALVTVEERCDDPWSLVELDDRDRERRRGKRRMQRPVRSRPGVQTAVAGAPVPVLGVAGAPRAQHPGNVPAEVTGVALLDPEFAIVQPSVEVRCQTL